VERLLEEKEGRKIMNITFDIKFKQRVWQAINSEIEDKTCPFCGVKITGKNFRGAAFINNEFRAFDGNLVCLLQLSEAKHEI
jgi:hypothetical protein